MSNTRRTVYRTLIIAIAALNLADLTGLWDQPMPVPAMLFSLNLVLFIRLFDVKVTTDGGFRLQITAKSDQ